MNSIKHLIFDVDGVLVESEHANFISLQKTALLFDFQITREEDMMLGPIPTFAKLSYLEEKHDRILSLDDRTMFMKKKFEYLLELDHLLTLNHTAYQTIKQAKEHGLIVTLASNARPQYLDVIISKLGIGDLVDDYVGNTSGHKHKPDPDMFVFLADKFNTAPHECLIFEDQPKNLTQAIKLGFQTRLVTSFDDVNLKGVTE